MRALRIPVALLVSLSLPGVAFAQVPPPPTAPAQPKSEPEPEPEPEPELSEEEKLEKAKKLYIEAEGLAAEDNWADAVPLYEEAYYLVPGKHGFAHKVGIATWKIGNCDKTKEYLTHFVTYATDEKYDEKRAEAQAILDEIEERQCATPEPEPEPDPDPVALENPLDENPLDEGTDTGGDKSKEKKGMLIGGAVLITLGVGGLAAGAAGAAIASSAGNSLDDLSSTNTLTGYPTGDYACRGVGSEQCPTDLEGKLATGKLLGYVGFIGGGVLLATGVALIAVHATKKKKGGGANAKAKSKVELTAAGPMLLPGGGGAMAGIRF